MSDPIKDLFARLCAPLPHVKKRNIKDTATGNTRAVAFVTGRHIQNQLDEVVGPENWWPVYRVVDPGCVICELTIRLVIDGKEHLLTKPGVGVGKNPKDASSDALKRAGVEFGISRYLYNVGLPGYALAHHEAGPGNGGKTGPDDHQQPSSRPSTNGQGPAPQRNGNGNGHGGGGGETNGSGYAVSYDCPANGRRLYAWAKDMENRLGVAVIQHTNNHRDVKGTLPEKMVEWNETETKIGYGIMVQCWRKNGVWPPDQQDEDPPIDAFGPPPDEEIKPPPANAADLKPVKDRIKSIAEDIHKLKNGEHVPPMRHPAFLTMLNWFATNRCDHQGPPIENYIDCRDGALLEKLVVAMSQTMNNLIQKKAAGAPQ